jgi:hypothetical protein
MPKEAPSLAVEIPAEGRDKPAWVKVGVIAAVGFVVGIAWPRIVGVRLGPSAPTETAASASHGARAPEPPSAPPSVAIGSPAKAGVSQTAVPSAAPLPVAAPSAAAAPPNVTVQKGLVVSCKTDGGDTKKGPKECGSVPGIDALVTPRVRKVANCAGVEGQTGKLLLTVNADFASGRLWYDVGKGSTLPNMDAVTSCLKTTFHGTSAAATPHEHPRYTVAYTATFATGDEGHKAADKAKEAPPEEKAEPAAPSKEGEAQVAWEVALVRDSPKTGALVSRLPRGSKVKVGPTRDGWYQVKFGENFANEGWVYRGAIGR